MLPFQISLFQIPAPVSVSAFRSLNVCLQDAPRFGPCPLWTSVCDHRCRGPTGTIGADFLRCDNCCSRQANFRDALGRSRLPPKKRRASPADALHAGDSSSSPLWQRRGWIDAASRFVSLRIAGLTSEMCFWGLMSPLVNTHITPVARVPGKHSQSPAGRCETVTSVTTRCSRHVNCGFPGT